MDISTFRSYYYIDKIYRFIDHFAKFMNSSWENFKNINIVFPSLFLSFFKFSFFPSQNGRLMDEKKNRERNTNEHATHIFIPRFEKLLSKDRKLEFTLPSRIIIANLKLKLANSLPNQMFDYITTSPLLRNPSEKDRKAALYRVFRYTEIIFLSSVIVNRIHLVRSFFLARFTPLLSGHPASTPKNTCPMINPGATRRLEGWQRKDYSVGDISVRDMLGCQFLEPITSLRATVALRRFKPRRPLSLADPLPTPPRL